MGTPQHLAVIDLLCSRDLPAGDGRSAYGFGGPGYHVGELLTGEDFLTDGGAGRATAREQFEAERDGLAELLALRWGPPQLMGLGTVRLRALDRGEEIPEPWAALSVHVPDVLLWRTGRRWVAVGVSQQGAELPYQLLVVVTDTDPP